MILGNRQRPPVSETKRGRNILATAVVLFMLTAQGLSAAHFLLIPHTIDRHTGKVVRLRTPHEHPKSPEGNGHGSGEDPRPQRPSSDEECPVYMLLHQSKIPVTETDTSIPNAPLSLELVESLPETLADIHRRLYLVSPSHSPPDA
jgi:hypothetical protein